jgi:hypothetical protein
MNVEINKNNLAEAQERVQNFKKTYDAFHNAIDDDASTFEKIKTVREYDFHRKSQQYIADLDFLIENGITPKPKGILGTLRVSQLIKKDDVLNDLSVMIYLSESYSKEKKERKEKIENDRKAQEKSQQEEADRSAKSQQEILDYQNGVKN